MRSPSGVIGLVIVVALVLCAGFADYLAPYSPSKMGAGGRFVPPGGKYLLGTDEFATGDHRVEGIVVGRVVVDDPVELACRSKQAVLQSAADGELVGSGC